MNVTVISRNNMDFLMGEDKSAGQMVDFLNSGAMYRTFGQVLTRAYPGKDLKEKLEDGMTRVTGDDRSAIVRKVHNWISGKNVPKNRETLFQICFVLGLDETESSRVLGAAADTGIHYRNPR